MAFSSAKGSIAPLLGGVLGLLAPEAGANPWWAQTTGPAYQVIVYSYADSDGDGWGDLQGLQNRLDTLDKLGVQTLWLSPVQPASSYHGYDVTNYLDIDPRLGTLENFDHLVAAAHKRGMHILLDLVINHTSSKHPWFQEFLAHPEGPYGDYYVWKRPEVTYGNSENAHWYPTASGRSYFSAFTETMPDLNHNSLGVQNEVQNLVRFWLERGVDGFRFDAAKHIFDPGEIPATQSALALNKAFWVKLRNFARSVNPEVFFLGEVLTYDASTLKAYAGGFDSLFDYPNNPPLVRYTTSDRSFSASAADADLATKLLRNLRVYSGVPGYVNSPFLGNHDLDRTLTINLSGLGLAKVTGWAPATTDNVPVLEAKAAAVARSKLQAALLFTLPGMPWIYYGDELGMSGRKYQNTDVARRDAFPWGDANPLGDNTTWAADSGHLETRQNEDTPSWADQLTDPTSLLAVYRQWGSFRRDHTVLAGGSFTLPEAKLWKGLNVGALVAWQRGEKQALLVTANLGPAPVSFSVPESKALKVELWLATSTDSDPPVPGNTITLPPMSVTLWSLE